MALGLDLHHFEIGDRGQQLGVPVDQPLVLVDEPFAIKLHEDFQHRARQPLVHGEALARPVAGGAQPLELVDDGAADFRLPFPHPLEERLAPHLAAAGLLPLHQLPLDHHLRGDAGMVGARLPEHVLAAHALEPAQHVLQRVVERMAHMQRAGDVGRRNDDRVRLARPRARAGRRGRRPPLPTSGRCGPRPRRADRSYRSLSFVSGIPCSWRGYRKPVPHWVPARGDERFCKRALNPPRHQVNFAADPATTGSATSAITLLALAAFAAQAMVRVTDSLLPQIAADLNVSVGAPRSWSPPICWRTARCSW